MATAALSGVDDMWLTSGNDLVCFQEAAARARALGLPSPRVRTMVHEHVSLSIAMGQTLPRGRPSIAAAHVDVGLLHMGGALHNARVGAYPVMIITGAPAVVPAGRRIPVFWKQQRWDQGEIVRQFMKWDHVLAPYDDASVVMARALQVALSAPQGPVYLVVPKEVGSQRLEGEMDILSADALGVPHAGAGSHGSVTEAAKKLLGAEAPLIVTDRVGNDPLATKLLAELSQEFAIAVRASRHRMNLADDHPSRAAAGDINTAGVAMRDGLISVPDADVILVLQHPVPWIPVQEQPQADTWVMFVGDDPAALDIPIYEFKADERVLCEPAAFLEALIDEMRRRRTVAQSTRIRERWGRFEDAAARRRERLGRWAKEAPDGTISEHLLSWAMNEVLRPDDVVMWELAETNGIERTEPRTLFDSGGSSLGWGVAAGIGYQMDDPGRFVACTSGDGAYMFGSPTPLLWAQQQYDAPVMTVITNNRGYRTGTVRLVEDYPGGYAERAGDFTGGTFDPPPDFAAQAEAAGGFGRKVLEPSELLDALKEARRAVEVDRRPAVVDVWMPSHITGEHPLLSVGERS
jgi:acetolactate synthase I/II/III large subunit